MKQSKFNLLALVWVLLIFSACSGSDPEIDPPFDPNDLPVISPGEMIPMSTKVSIEETGTYLLPNDANVITTRCFGKVTLTFEQSNGNVQINTCQNSTGSSSQTNAVTGVSDVHYEIEAGAHAEVTVN